MDAVLALLALSALVGLFFGLYFTWAAILISSPIIAFVSATVLHDEGWDFPAGFAISVACVTVNQVAFSIGVTLTTRRPRGR
jgi:hypothetical protein